MCSSDLCKFKNVKIDVKGFENGKDNFKNAWENSLRHQLKYFQQFLKGLEILGGGIKR